MINVYIRNDKIPQLTEPIKTRYHTLNQFHEQITEKTVTDYFRNPNIFPKPILQFTEENIRSHTNDYIDGFPYLTVPCSVQNTWNAVILYLDNDDQIRHLIPKTGNIDTINTIVKYNLLTPEALEELKFYDEKYGLRTDKELSEELFGSQITFQPDEELITDHLTEHIIFAPRGIGIQWDEDTEPDKCSNLEFLQRFQEKNAAYQRTVGLYLPGRSGKNPDFTVSQKLLTCFASQIRMVQEAMARYGISPSDLNRELQRRNMTTDDETEVTGHA